MSRSCYIEKINIFAYQHHIPKNITINSKKLRFKVKQNKSKLSNQHHKNIIKLNKPIFCNIGQNPSSSSSSSSSNKLIEEINDINSDINSDVSNDVNSDVSNDDDETLKSDEYNKEMQDKMSDDSLIYRHERGMNYSRMTNSLIVGSCLQNPSDVDKLADKESVSLIICLQEDINLDYFDVDITAIQNRCNERGDIKHLRLPIRDFDPMDLRNKLPQVVATIFKEEESREEENDESTIYIHCTAGLGRAPAVALSYLFWCRNWTLEAANKRLQEVRPCGPKLFAIRQATCDLVYGSNKKEEIIKVKANPKSIVQISGLDVGWGKMIDLEYDSNIRRFKATRNLLPGRYMFKFIIDGEWLCSRDYDIHDDNGNENNILDVTYDFKNPHEASSLHRLLSDNGQITLQERWEIMATLRRLVY